MEREGKRRKRGVVAGRRAERGRKGQGMEGKIERKKKVGESYHEVIYRNTRQRGSSLEVAT